jgi:hypothetical protein
MGAHGLGGKPLEGGEGATGAHGLRGKTLEGAIERGAVAGEVPGVEGESPPFYFGETVKELALMAASALSGLLEKLFGRRP